MSHAYSQKWMPWGILVPPSPSLEYFFSPPLLHSQAKSRLKSGVGWPAKIYENWKAFQCFSPHVMLISSSKGSWLNFLFRNRRIFWIETFVIYKLGRLSALPVQQASRWGGGALQYIWVGCSTTMYAFVGGLLLVHTVHLWGFFVQNPSVKGPKRVCADWMVPPPSSGGSNTSWRTSKALIHIMYDWQITDILFGKLFSWVENFLGLVSNMIKRAPAWRAGFTAGVLPCLPVWLSFVHQYTLHNAQMVSQYCPTTIPNWWAVFLCYNTSHTAGTGATVPYC